MLAVRLIRFVNLRGPSETGSMVRLLPLQHYLRVVFHSFALHNSIVFPPVSDQASVTRQFKHVKGPIYTVRTYPTTTVSQYQWQINNVEPYSTLFLKLEPCLSARPCFLSPLPSSAPVPDKNENTRRNHMSRVPRVFCGHWGQRSPSSLRHVGVPDNSKSLPPRPISTFGR